MLRFLWAVGEPSAPAQVHEAVAPDLAYTTVMTVLSRLHEKGALERQRHGRAFVYWPSEGEGEHRAGRMHDVLDQAADRKAVLSSFIETLTPAEAQELRQMLGEADQ